MLRAIKFERIERLHQATTKHPIELEGTTLVIGPERLDFVKEPQVFCDLCNRIKFEGRSPS